MFERPPSGKAGLPARPRRKRPRRNYVGYRETPDVVAATRRLIRAIGKRIGEEDPDDLELLRRLEAEVDEAWRVALAGQRRAGFSDGDIARALGRTRLRKVGEAQEKLMVKAAVAKAEEIAADFQQRMLTEQWSREQALHALRDLPRVQELMPPLDPRELHEIARQEHKGRYRYGRGLWPELMPGEKDGDDE
jgi:hypothetical protein